MTLAATTATNTAVTSTVNSTLSGAPVQVAFQPTAPSAAEVEATHRTAGLRGRLLPLYHPGRRALVHRSEAAQCEDWRGFGEMVAATNRLR